MPSANRSVDDNSQLLLLNMNLTLSQLFLLIASHQTLVVVCHAWKTVHTIIELD